MPTDLVMVPIMVNLMLIFGFIFMGAILFASWEGWSPTTAAYFCFVTLTTIGFGDYTPVKSFNGFEHDPVAAMKMCFTVFYCPLNHHDHHHPRHIFSAFFFHIIFVKGLLLHLRDDPPLHVHEPHAGADCGKGGNLCLFFMIITFL